MNTPGPCEISLCRGKKGRATPATRGGCGRPKSSRYARILAAATRARRPPRRRPPPGCAPAAPPPTRHRGRPVLAQGGELVDAPPTRLLLLHDLLQGGSEVRVPGPPPQDALLQRLCQPATAAVRSLRREASSSMRAYQGAPSPRAPPGRSCQDPHLTNNYI